jgi:hypothetical protein
LSRFFKESLTILKSGLQMTLRRSGNWLAQLLKILHNPPPSNSNVQKTTSDLKDSVGTALYNREDLPRVFLIQITSSEEDMIHSNVGNFAISHNRWKLWMLLMVVILL